MSIRVSKPAVNLREKLSEIDIPTTGSHGSQLMKSVDASESFSLVKAGRKNMIINGACSINQRNGGSSVTIPNASGGTYQLDRWAVNEATDGTVSVNMDGDPPNYPHTGAGEFQKAMQVACSGTDTSLASTQNLHFFQNIEGYNTTHLEWGTSKAKSVTLSFWVKTNNKGVYAVGLENNGTDRCCIREFHHDGSHTWQKFSLTYPGCPDGTWLKTNGIGIRVRFCLASGTQYDDGKDGEWVSSDELTAGRQTNFMSSTNNRFFITGVQLEEGTAATPFEHRLYPEELELCQRYFYSITGTPWGTSGTNLGNNARQALHWNLPTTMRANPTIAYEDAQGTASRVTYHSGNYGNGANNNHTVYYTNTSVNHASIIADPYTGYDFMVSEIRLTAEL